MERYQTFIGGQWVDASDGGTFETINPYTGEPWATLPRCREADVNRAVTAADRAFHSGAWPTLKAHERGALLRRLGDLIGAHAEHLADIEVRDNGKLRAEMAGQCRYLPQWCYYYGGLADKVEGQVLPIDKPDLLTYTRYEPLGVVAAITPWNSPLLLTMWKLAPALAAGNTLVLKPSEFTSASTLELMRLVEQAGFPPGVVNVVTGFGHEAGAPLVAHDAVRRVAFTGGEAGGQAVYEAAAKGLKPVTLELGGKSPNIVFDDAVMDDAVKGVVAGIFAATGQTCLAGSRLLLQRTIYDEFLDRLVTFASQARMGDPAHPDTQVGPVTTPPQYQKILDYIEIAKAEGARCLLGGGPARRPECGAGQFVEPTVFADVDNRMRIAQEEVFGPVLAAIPFDDEEDAVAIANDIAYGLAAGVWTQNTRRAIEVSNRLQAGTVWVNTYRAVSYMAPFGGYKRSGLGRENGLDAIKDYLQLKTVWISTARETPNPFVMR